MYSVVIVDDEPTIVEGLSRLLPWKDYGCEVVATADDGLSALSTIREVKPDILFTDIRMPSLDGLSMIAGFRSEFPHIQITILSGYPDFEYAQKAIQMGVSNYILKPSRMEELETALKTMVEKLDAQKALPPDSSPNPIATDDGPKCAGNFIVDNALAYMREHFSEKLTLPEVAERIYVSQWHLSKLIAKHTGKSFSDLLNGIRIQKAKELLTDSSLRIWEISEMVGFSDVTHFSRIFKKTENCSANEYRNKGIYSGGA